jgi:hypothetical protein
MSWRCGQIRATERNMNFISSALSVKQLIWWFPPSVAVDCQPSTLNYSRKHHVMIEPIIHCPKCEHEFKLTESLAAPLLHTMRHQFEAKLAEKDQDIAAREAAIQSARENIAKDRAGIAEQVAGKVQAEREVIAVDEARKARLALGTEIEQKTKELDEMQLVINDKNTKLAEAQQVQADLMKKQRQLDDDRREMDLTIEKRIQESLVSVRDKAKLEAELALQLKVTEKEEQIASMQRQIEELRRRAEQGSQQLQGEAFELQLEAVLRARFPRDTIEPVAKGEFGGDVLQTVFGPTGQPCGSILWESKRTRSWSDGWLGKLRDDKRAAKAEIALLVSNALPKGVETFDLIDGVWVTDVRCMVPVAISLRQSLIDLAAARQSREGQQTKMELVYEYLTGPRFRHRIDAIVERFSDMQTDLDKERKHTMRIWAKREEQIRGVIESTVGMYGDLQGIAGRAMPEIESLDVLAIEQQAAE